jgi:hypothetical protein
MIVTILTFTQLVVLSLLLLAVEASSHPSPWPYLNTPQTRDQWTNGFGIYTDYEEQAPKGRLREVGCGSLEQKKKRANKKP